MGETPLTLSTPARKHNPKSQDDFHPKTPRKTLRYPTLHVKASPYRMVGRPRGQKVLRPRGPGACPHRLGVPRQRVREGSGTNIAQSCLGAIVTDGDKMVLPGCGRHGCGVHLAR